MVPLAGPGGKLAVFELAKSGRIPDSVIVTGFSRQSDRQVMIYQTCWKCLPPSWSPSTLFLSGKGETTTNGYKITEDVPHMFPLSFYKTNAPSQGLSFIAHKNALNVRAKWSLRAATGWPAPGSHPSHSQCPRWSTTTSRMTLLAQVCFDLILNHVCIYWKSSQTTEEGKFLLWIITDYRGSCRFV